MKTAKIAFPNANRYMGRARHSVRAVVEKPNALVANRGGQGTDRPTNVTN
jgi:hypothetical protein